MTELAEFRAETRAWLEENCPAGARGPGVIPIGSSTIELDVDTRLWLERMAERGWTVSNLAYALKTGVTPAGDVFGGSMVEVVQNGTSFLSKADLAAIATYLLDSDVAEDERVAQAYEADKGATRTD